SLSSCLGVDAGFERCTPDAGCPRGYTCQDGRYCFLRGYNSAVQVTLRFNQPVDMDLHVDEPTADSGVCEVFWADPNHAFSGGCGRGSLDLDSNPSCMLDNVD